MNNKILIGASVVLGILFLVLTAIYWTVAAGSLPMHMPGFTNGSTTIHFKHGLGAFILAIALFVFAWFKSGSSK